MKKIYIGILMLCATFGFICAEESEETVQKMALYDGVDSQEFKTLFDDLYQDITLQSFPDLSSELSDDYCERYRQFHVFSDDDAFKTRSIKNELAQNEDEKEKSSILLQVKLFEKLRILNANIYCQGSVIVRELQRAQTSLLSIKRGFIKNRSPLTVDSSPSVNDIVATLNTASDFIDKQVSFIEKQIQTILDQKSVISFIYPEKGKQQPVHAAAYFVLKRLAQNLSMIMAKHNVLLKLTKMYASKQALRQSSLQRNSLYAQPITFYAARKILGNKRGSMQIRFGVRSKRDR